MLGGQIQVDLDQHALGIGKALYCQADSGHEMRDFFHRVQAARVHVGEMIPHGVGQGGQHSGRTSQSMPWRNRLRQPFTSATDSPGLDTTLSSICPPVRPVASNTAGGWARPSHDQPAGS